MQGAHLEVFIQESSGLAWVFSGLRQQLIHSLLVEIGTVVACGWCYGLGLFP
jgi:hypothetical protein